MTGERPPGDDEGDDRGMTSGDPLDAEREPAPPAPPWRRDVPAGDAPPARSWRPYPDDEPEADSPAASGPHEAFGTEPPPEAQDAFGAPERIRPDESAPRPSWPPAPPPREAEPPRDADPEPEAAESASAPEAPAPRPPGSIGPPGYERPAGAAPVPSRPTAPSPPAAASGLGQRHVLAGWWRRVAAYVIDAIVIGVVVTLVIVIITGAAGGVGFLGGETTGYGGIVLGLLFGTLIATAVALLYAPLYMARTNGQTLGKQLMSIRVIRAGGQQVDFLWAVLREVVIKALVFAGLGSSVTFGLAWLLDSLWPLWDDENRALHDLIVDSRVVRA